MSTCINTLHQKTNSNITAAIPSSSSTLTVSQFCNKLLFHQQTTKFHSNKQTNQKEINQTTATSDEKIKKHQQKENNQTNQDKQSTNKESQNNRNAIAGTINLIFLE